MMELWLYYDKKYHTLDITNKTKDWALVQTAALVIEVIDLKVIEK